MCIPSDEPRKPPNRSEVQPSAPEERCAQCERLRSTRHFLLAQMRGNCLEMSIPPHLLRAYYNHTGRDWNDRPTGAQPTNELCTTCYQDIGFWIHTKKYPHLVIRG